MRKATGRRVEGGSKIGRIDAFVGTVFGFVIRKGCTGVPNPGDDDGIGSKSAVIWEVAGVLVGRGVPSMLSRGWSCRENDQARISLKRIPQLNATLGPIQAISKLKKIQSFFSRFELSLLFDFTSFSIKAYVHVTRRRVTPRAADATRDKSAVPLTTTTTYRQRFMRNRSFSIFLPIYGPNFLKAEKNLAQCCYKNYQHGRRRAARKSAPGSER